MKNVLILNDFVSKGKIAARLMASVLAYMDVEVFLLPTAMIANNFSLGGNAFLNTNSYIKDCLDNWTRLGFKFDTIFIGYIDDLDQRNLIRDFLENLDYETTIILDPIMGDDGRLYPGLDDGKIENYKSLIDLADIVIPNETEAKFLNLDRNSFRENNKELIVTSSKEKDLDCVKVYGKNEAIIYFDKQEIKVGGSGDLFDGLFIGYKLKNYDTEAAIDKTCQDIIKILRANDKDNPGASEVNIEKYLTLIKE